MDTSDCINTFDLKLHKSRDIHHHILLEGLMIDSYTKKRYKMIPITEISITKINIEDRYKNVVEEVCGGFFGQKGTVRFINDILCVAKVKEVLLAEIFGTVDNKVLKEKDEDIKRSWTQYVKMRIDDIKIGIDFNHVFEFNKHNGVLYFYVCIKISSNDAPLKLHFRCKLVTSGYCRRPQNSVFSNVVASKFHKIVVKPQYKATKFMGIIMNKSYVLITANKISEAKKEKWEELTDNEQEGEDFNTGWSEIKVLIRKIATKLITATGTFVMDITTFYNKQYKKDEMSSWKSYENIAKLNNNIFTRVIFANIGNITFNSLEKGKIMKYEFVIPCLELYGGKSYGMRAKITVNKK